MLPHDDVYANLELAIQTAEMLTRIQSEKVLDLSRTGMDTSQARQELVECMDKLLELRRRKFLMQQARVTALHSASFRDEA